MRGERRGLLVRFSLFQLLLFVAVVALALATFGPWGIAVTLFLFVQMPWIRRPADGMKLVIFWGVLFVLVSCTFHVDKFPNSICWTKLGHIGMALHRYHDQHGRFPPQYIADAEGRPMHSWRVLILPYLRESDATKVYEQYNFDEPWNGPNNRRLAGQLGGLFLCPTTRDQEPGSPLATHYVAVTGPGTAWPGAAATRLEDMTDGSGDTIMIVEIADSVMHWMEPRDITLEEALSERDGSIAVPSSHHYVPRVYFFLSTYPLVGHVLMVDGNSYCLEHPPSRNDLAALLTIDGGEPIDADALFERHHRTLLQDLDLKRCLSFALFFAAFAMLTGCRCQKQESRAWPVDRHAEA